MAIDDLRLIAPEGNDTPTWAGYTLDDAAWIDTGTWMGWLNVAQTPWLWSTPLESWIYMGEDFVTEEGGWFYLFLR